MESKHIPRKYGMTNIKKEHTPRGEVVVEVHAFDKSSEQTWLYGSVNHTNSSMQLWKAWEGLKCDDTTNYTVSFEYYAPKTGEYQLELLYSSNITEGFNLLANLYVDDERLELSGMQAYSGVQKRHVQPLELDEGLHTFKYHFDDTVIWLGNVIKRFDTYTGDTHNKGQLTLLEANYKSTGGTSIDELNFKILYEEWFEDNNITRDDLKFNPSGYIFDYRDEVNFYVITNGYTDYNDGTGRFKTNLNGGELRQIFGGYISSISAASDLTTMEIKCASRLQDGEIRHTIQEISIGGGTSESEGYDESSIIDFDSYLDATSGLLDTFETPIKNNIVLSSDVGTMEQSDEIYWSYWKGGNGGYVANKILTEQRDDGLFLRNNPDTSFQSLILYDTARDGEPKIDLVNYPNFQIRYSMGEPKWEEEVADTEGSATGGGTSSGYTGQAFSGTPQSVLEAANRATKAGTSNPHQVIIDCAVYMKTTLGIQWRNYRNFVYPPTTVLNNRWANCCDGSRLLAAMCASKGVYINYVQVKSGSRGHIFNRFKGVYYDWIKMKDKSCVGQYVTGYGTLPGRESTYPNTPF